MGERPRSGGGIGEGAGDRAQGGKGFEIVDGAEEQAGGGGGILGKSFHAGLAGEDGIGADGLAEALDGCGGEGGRDGLAMGMAAAVEAQEILAEVGGEVGVGIAKEAGEVVCGGAGAHALEIDHDGEVAAEEDVAGLPVAVDEGFRRSGEAACDGTEFERGGGAGGFGHAWEKARRVAEEIGVFPGIERVVERGHEVDAGTAGGGEAEDMQAEGGFEQAAIYAEAFGGFHAGEAGFQRVGAEVFDGQEAVAGAVHFQGGDGDAERGEETGMARVETVVGSIRRPADEDGRTIAVAEPEKFAGGAARGQHFDGEKRNARRGGREAGPDAAEEGLFARGENGGGREREGRVGTSDPAGDVAVGLQVLGRGADVGPERARDEDCGDGVAPGLGAAICVDDRIESGGRDETEDAAVEEVEAAESGMAAVGIVEVADEAVFAQDGFRAGVFGEPAGGKRFFGAPG